MSDGPTVGDEWYGNEVLELRELSAAGWKIYKVAGTKSEDDFKVKVINPDHPIGITVQHAHFAIDLFGKISRDREDGRRVAQGIFDIWRGDDVEDVLEDVETETSELPGYDLEYIYVAYDWILKQEDINYDGGRGEGKQEELDKSLESMGVEKLEGREGSELAIALICDIADGEHPVEALRQAGLTITPRR